jgi:hypothetical protein
VLVSQAGAIRRLDPEMEAALAPGVLEEIVGAVPEAWLASVNGPGPNADDLRRAYVRYLTARLEEPRLFVEEALGAR